MPRRETNDVWKEFTKTKDPENGRVNEIWKCNHCPKEYAVDLREAPCEV
jgi:hypothetical protein